MGKAFKLLIYVWICKSEYFNNFFLLPGNFVGYYMVTHLYECTFMLHDEYLFIYSKKSHGCFVVIQILSGLWAQRHNGEIFCLYLRKIKGKCLMLLLKIEF